MKKAITAMITATTRISIRVRPLRFVGRGSGAQSVEISFLDSDSDTAEAACKEVKAPCKEEARNHSGENAINWSQNE